MNPTLEVIQKRRSTRAYADRSLSQEDKDMILNAAFRAPTAGNMMLYSIIEVEDQALKDRLAVTCDNQPFIAKAPYLLLFLADYQRWHDFYQYSGAIDKGKELNRQPRRPQVGDLLLACCDTLIAAQNAVIAAESIGIGSCYIGDILENYEIHRELFCLPQYVIPITLLCFGYPAAGERRGKPTRRFRRELIVHKNTYQPMDAGRLDQMMQDMNSRISPQTIWANGIENPGQANYFRKFLADFSIEMSRSVAEMLKNWQG
jgi:FMN reductase (NADPH)/FMN reductase [NAD(P)H]